MEKEMNAGVERCVSRMWRSTIALMATIASLQAESGMVLARRGTASDCAIVVAKDADEAVRYAARELRHFAKRMIGVDLKITESPSSRKSIVLETGGARLNAACAEGSEPIPVDAFRLKVEDGRLYVTGGGSRGVLYGVYELLERFGGCEWYAPWCENIPSRREFSVPDDLDVSERPAFIHRNASWRQVHTRRDRASRDFAARMRFTANPEPRYGGQGMKFVRKLGSCHTFYTLVPPKEHFASHPEWFSEIKGRRTGERAQLCLSNAELVKFVAEEIKRRLRDEPTAQMVGVSQNDWKNYCQCPECSRCAREEGSQAGPNLKFVNAVAEEIEKEFPRIIVETLAYQYTRRPPKNIRPRHNVAVCLCSFECSFSVPFAESRHVNTVGFVENIRAWGRICRNLMVYDYCTNFRNYLLPFPNIYSMAPNYRLFKECGTKWLYSQGGGDGFHAEFAELKCYLQSKLMWNPHQDADPLIDRFLKGYYGAAAPYVRQYINELYASFGISAEHRPDPDAEPAGAGIYGESLPSLTEERIARWMELWGKAEEAVRGDGKFEYNVRMGVLPLQYTRLKRLYERGYKTVWAAENPAPHMDGMRSIQSLASEFVERGKESASRKLGFALAENYRTRHVMLMRHFSEIKDWQPPAKGCASVQITTNDLEYIEHERLWQMPIRLMAVDEGGRYRVRIRLKSRKPAKPRLGAGYDRYGFAAGLRVRWIPKAKGRRRIEVPREKVSDDWAWHDIGEYDFSELQKIPLPTMDGLCLFVQGDVEIDCIEIAKVTAESNADAIINAG